ncbi:MAG: c-type cytochrome [Verrucomicrobiales bacterium]
MQNTVCKVIRERAWAIAIIWMLAGFGGVAHGQKNNNSGVEVKFTSGDMSQTTVLPNFWLYVTEGAPPVSGLKPGPFSAEFNGLVSVDLRGQYAFQAELRGKAEISVNGRSLMEAAGEGTTTEISRQVRLNKGTNLVTVKFTSAVKGDSQFRLYWAPKGTVPVPIPLQAITYSPTPESITALKINHGREVFAEFRCAKCHIPEQSKGMPEMEMDAPHFDNIGSRVQQEWMAHWIENPMAMRKNSRMPKVLHGPTAKEDATAAAAYLASLRDSHEKMIELAKPSPEVIEKGKALFTHLHCAACHVAPEEKADPAGSLISLTHVLQKFRPGQLEAFLKAPHEHYKWSRMPNFKFTDEEAFSVASYLTSKAEPYTTKSASSGNDLLERGKMVVSSRGCLNCHDSKLQNTYQTKNLASISGAGSLEKGCLSHDHANGTAPDFGLTADARDAVRAFLASGVQTLSQDIPREFALRQTRLMNCAGCHGKFEGFPPLEILGGKLQPEWSGKFIAGEIPYKPRPWLEARMPAFVARGHEIAQGLAMLHGYPPKTSPEGSINEEMAQVGRKLIGTDGGFSCISCHGVGSFAPTQVFESAGINLAYSGERLLKPFFHRWVLNPLAIDPTTKMPVYFDEEGRSPLPDVYEGDGAKQIEAMWQYVRQGEKMQAPTP